MKSFVMEMMRTQRIASGRRNEVPATGKFVQIPWDWETRKWNFASRGVDPENYNLTYNKITGLYEGMPAKNPYATLPGTVVMPGMKWHVPSEFGYLTEPWQNFWFDCIGLATNNTWGFPELALAWLRITRDGAALTDDHSHTHNESRNTDVSKMFREYITGKNLTTNNKDMAIRSLNMVGNIAKVIGDDGAGNWWIETLDIDAPPPDVEWAWERPWLVGWLTQTAVNPTRCIDWGDLGPYGVPFPVIGAGGRNKLPKTQAKPIGPGPFSPYVAAV